MFSVVVNERDYWDSKKQPFLKDATINYNYMIINRKFAKLLYIYQYFDDL